MKFAIAFLTVALAAVALAADNGSVLRLPLPDRVKLAYPELVHEPIMPENDFVRIVGGENAQAGEAPYQVALFRSGGFLCGGELIAPSIVLTAAHCVFGYENQASVFTIRYGNINRDQGTLVQVTRVTRHPNYSSSTTDNDVAILALATAFTPSANAQQVALADSDPADGSSLVLSGWGRLVSGGASPTILQIAKTLQITPRSECTSIWSAAGSSVTSNMICAIATSQSACNGDSGGPLVQNGVLVGVVSWGSSSCLHATRPNVYARVSVLKSWILANSY